MSSIQTADSIWARLAKNDDPQAKKVAWRLCREFRDPSCLQSLAKEYDWCWQVVESSGSIVDRAVKLLLENSAGERVESVLLLPTQPVRQKPVRQKPGRLPRATVCVSSQPGCGVGCPFCATGQLGYRGNLSAEQITEQVYWAGLQSRVMGRRLRNVVYMGMGEPLHNADAVFQSLQWLTHEKLFGLAERHITVSTVGVPRAMRRIAKAFPEVRLALSLHAVDQQLRERLVPAAIHCPDRLKTTIAEINALQPGRPAWLEVVLLHGINDSDKCAQQLIEFCKSIQVEINLIPYNDTGMSQIADGFDREFRATPKPHREHFAAQLRAAGIRTTLRTSFGSTASAACGQLAGNPQEL